MFIYVNISVYMCTCMCMCVYWLYSLSLAFFSFCYSHPVFLPWSYPPLFFVTYWYLFSPLLFTISFIFSLVFLFVWYLFHYFTFTFIVLFPIGLPFFFNHFLCQRFPEILFLLWIFKHKLCICSATIHAYFILPHCLYICTNEVPFVLIISVMSYIYPKRCKYL